MGASPAQDSSSSQWSFSQESPPGAVLLNFHPLPICQLERKLPLKRLSFLRVGTLSAAHRSGERRITVHDMRLGERCSLPRASVTDSYRARVHVPPKDQGAFI